MHLVDDASCTQCHAARVGGGGVGGEVPKTSRQLINQNSRVFGQLQDTNASQKS